MLSIKVPPLGESITEATVSRWLKNEGDAVTAGETLVELETDKITVEVPALKAGLLTKRNKAEGDVVAVNDTLGEMEEAGAGAPRVSGATAAAAPAAPVAAAPAAAAPASAPAQTPVAPSRPTIATTVVPPPARPSVPVQPPAATPTAQVPPGATNVRVTPAGLMRTVAPETPPAPGSPAAPPASMPAARRLAGEWAIDLAKVTGTGRGGMISKPDIIAAAAAAGAAPPASDARAAAAAPAAPAAPPAAPRPSVPSAPIAPAAPVAPPAPPAAAAPAPATPAAPAPEPAQAPPSVGRKPASALPRETREKMSTRRKRIAENLLQAQHATAHLTTFNEIDMSAIIALRERVKEKVEKEHGVKLSFMPFFAKAAIMALKAFPIVNSQIDGDSIVHRNYVNLGIAVASEAGLVVPNVKDADSLGILGLSQEIAAVAKRARDGKLTMNDLMGGTFTITNGGVFGSLISTPIINYPQSGILGLHKTQDRPIALNGEVVIRPMMYVALSYDHRIIDGQQAVLFLVKMKELMEEPGAMLIE